MPGSVVAFALGMRRVMKSVRERLAEACAEAGVSDIIEVRIGYDGIVFASDINGNSFAFTPSDWFNALSPKVLVDGQLVDNPYTSWNQVNADFADQPIAAFIPGTKHGTREVFEEKVLAAGCEATGAMKAMRTRCVRPSSRRSRHP